MFKHYNFLVSQLHMLQTVTIIWLSIGTVGERKSILSIVFSIKQFIFSSDLYYLMNKVKTGHPDSDKVQVTENITLK